MAVNEMTDRSVYPVARVMASKTRSCLQVDADADGTGALQGKVEQDEAGDRLPPL
jgi:hypothetical protein